jgi:23S rRNA (adenine2503-C2)-methyltransferase
MNLEMANKTNLLNLDRQGLEQFFAGIGEKPFRATQIMKWIYQQGVDDFNVMTNLSKILRERLSEIAVITLPEVMVEQPSRDGTIKWLLRLDEHNSVETVYIPSPEGDRGTLCVSSQVGCSLACSFCSTARQGFNRNLSTAEIIGQVVVAARKVGLPLHGEDKKITNIVMMGMGEPLLNMGALIPAIKLMMDDFSFAISKRRLTVSTAGVVPAIDELREKVDVCLAVSLHATNDVLRDQLVPLNRKYPIEELMEACKRYVCGRHHNRVTVEYTMLKDVNDSLGEARSLLKLLRNVPSKINLIPFNPFPGSDYQPSDLDQINRFRDVLMKGGIITVTRKTRGDDIDAACGQLVGKVNDKTRRSRQHEGISEELLAS